MVVLEMWGEAPNGKCSARTSKQILSTLGMVCKTVIGVLFLCFVRGGHVHVRVQNNACVRVCVRVRVCVGVRVRVRLYVTMSGLQCYSLSLCGCQSVCASMSVCCVRARVRG